MWVKRSPEELTRARAERRKRRLLQALAFSGVAFVLVTFTHAKRWRWQYSSWLASPAEIPHRMLIAVPASIVVGLFVYWLCRERRMMVCPKCGATKYDDSVLGCACGGTFEEMETMKWHGG